MKHLFTISIGSLLIIYTSHVLARPVSVPGQTQYVTKGPVVLDGSASYDPNGTSPLIYRWIQTGGSSVTLTDNFTATPTIHGFMQSNEVQRFTFTLLVSDGTNVSDPCSVDIVVLADYTGHEIEVRYNPFDPNKPTFIGFSGGDCTTGRPFVFDNYPEWHKYFNIITSVDRYRPPYDLYADAVIHFLAQVAPDYHHKIQTGGFSTGGQPAMAVALRLNGVFTDPRYNINHVSLFDATGYCQFYHYWEKIPLLTNMVVDGESCWVANYSVEYEEYNTLNILFPGQIHQRPRRWHEESIELMSDSDGGFNNGVYGGFYMSVAGPARNLCIGKNTDIYRFLGSWYSLDMHDPKNYPGRLPEPVTLIGPDPNTAPQDYLYTCAESQNSVKYEFLVGSDPIKVQHFEILLESNEPPLVLPEKLPLEATWWTIRAHNEYGATIYADPLPVDPNS